MIKLYNIEDNCIKPVESGDAQILVYINPGDADKEELISKYAIDEHTLNSALDPEELSRLEQEPEHISIILNRPKNYSGKDKLLFKIASMGFFLFKDKLIIIISEDLPLFIGKRFK
ncbi:MAG: CorA family divalent cation transporter, partial [Elusimicrobiaceae bacterium]